MAELTKRDGSRQPYMQSKVVQSLRQAGVAENTAREVADKVKPKDGERTTEFRKRVEAELTNRDPQAAERYRNTRRLEVREDDEVSSGSVRINPTTAENMGWKGGGITVGNEDNEMRLDIEESRNAEERTAYVNQRTLRSLGAQEGTRVRLTRRT